MSNRVQHAYDPATGPGLSFTQRLKAGVSTAIGATVALGIIFGLGVWFYRLGDRDARNVPIIRAATGDLKKIPADPGGAETPHKGVTSYEVAEGTTASVGAALIAPEPPAPRREDVAMGELVADEAKATATAAAIVTAPAEEPRAGETVADERAPSAADAVTEPVRREIAESGEKDATDAASEVAREEPEETRLAVAPEAAVLAPVRPERAETLAPAEEPAETAAAEETPSVPDEVLLVPGATEYAPGHSPTAPRRPGNLLARNEAAKEAAVTDATNLVVAAAASPFQIQLAADPDRDTIIKMWKRISNANKDVLNGRALSIQTTVSGGTTFFRLRVGPFGARAEAASVCQALKARNQDCIVARNL